MLVIHNHAWVRAIAVGNEHERRNVVTIAGPVSGETVFWHGIYDGHRWSLARRKHEREHVSEVSAPPAVIALHCQCLAGTALAAADILLPEWADTGEANANRSP